MSGTAATASQLVEATPAAKILIVDDEAGILRFLSRALAHYDVSTALSPEEALAVLDTDRIDLLLVDKNLPGMDGIELLRRARAANRRFEAVIMTGYASLESAIEAVDLRVFRYLTKPLDLELVRQAAAQALDRLRETERREQEFNAAVDQLILSEQRRGASERLVAIGQMAATLTHEIANPLCYLESCLLALGESFDVIGQPARERLAENPEGATRLGEALADVPVLLGDCNDAADRLKRLVREARGMYRPLDRQEAHLGEIIADALRIAAKRIPSHVQVETDAGEVPALHVDPIKLAQVIANLVINGADAVPPGSPEARVTVRTSCDAEWAAIEVRDTGSGIDPAAREHLFTPFFTTKSKQGGTGIGLALCRDIVATHRGRIEIDSEPGRGSCFRVLLPLRASTEAGAPRAAPKRARILWIEDDRRTLAVMLRALGERHQVVPATSGGQALALLRTDRRFDVVLCDLSAPGAGPAMWEQVRALDPALAERFVFLRAEGCAPEITEFVRGLDMPALPKPVSIEALERLLRSRN